MCDELDPLELANAIAEIARTTHDPETGMRLLQLVNQLLTAAGLPDDNEIGGRGPPPRCMSEPDCAPA
jgi:hypothetical protein